MSGDPNQTMKNGGNVTIY